MVKQISKESRHAALHNCPENVVDFLCDPLTYETLITTGKKHFPDKKEAWHTLVEIVNDAILGFYPISELPNLFVKNLALDQAKAEAVAADLAEFLQPLNENPPAAPTTETEKAPTDAAPETTEDIEVKDSAPEPETEKTAAPETPSSTPTAEKNISPIRTMETDAKRAKENVSDLVNQSQADEPVVEATSQTDTLTQRKSLAPTPNYHE